MTEAERWLRERVPAAPRPLVAAMIEALPERADSVPDAFVAGAVRLYGRVVRGSGQREDALPLLAADALLTHAFQAQAELEPAGLAALVDRCGAAGELGGVPL